MLFIYGPFCLSERNLWPFLASYPSIIIHLARSRHRIGSYCLLFLSILSLSLHTHTHTHAHGGPKRSPFSLPRSVSVLVDIDREFYLQEARRSATTFVIISSLSSS